MEKPTTICVILSLVILHSWFLCQLDVNNAFLQGRLDKDVYVSQSPGFIDSNLVTDVCKLNKAIYGLT